MPHIPRIVHRDIGYMLKKNKAANVTPRDASDHGTTVLTIRKSVTNLFITFRHGDLVLFSSSAGCAGLKKKDRRAKNAAWIIGKSFAKYIKYYLKTNSKEAAKLKTLIIELDASMDTYRMFRNSFGSALYLSLVKRTKEIAWKWYALCKRYKLLYRAYAHTRTRIQTPKWPATIRNSRRYVKHRRWRYGTANRYIPKRSFVIRKTRRYARSISVMRSRGGTGITDTPLRYARHTYVVGHRHVDIRKPRRIHRRRLYGTNWICNGYLHLPERYVDVRNRNHSRSARNQYRMRSMYRADIKRAVITYFSKFFFPSNIETVLRSMYERLHTPDGNTSSNSVFECGLSRMSSIVLAHVRNATITRINKYYRIPEPYHARRGWLVKYSLSGYLDSFKQFYRSICSRISLYRGPFIGAYSLAKSRFANCVCLSGSVDNAVGIYATFRLFENGTMPLVVVPSKRYRYKYTNNCSRIEAFSHHFRENVIRSRITMRNFRYISNQNISYILYDSFLRKQLARMDRMLPTAIFLRNAYVPELRGLVQDIFRVVLHICCVPRCIYAMLQSCAFIHRLTDTRITRNSPVTVAKYARIFELESRNLKSEMLKLVTVHKLLQVRYFRDLTSAPFNGCRSRYRLR